MELVDDCYAAVEVSRFLGLALESDLTAQLLADFASGLEDPDETGRIVSIQRVGGLRAPLSRPILHRVIEQGTLTEARWAVYAALRTGDTTVLPKVRDLLARKDSEPPEFFLAWELEKLTDQSAVPALIDIANSAAGAQGRKSALFALGRKIRAMEALPTLAAHLTDYDDGVRSYALEAMREMTHSEACTLPMEPRYTQDMVEPQIRRCKEWWDTARNKR